MTSVARLAAVTACAAAVGLAAVRADGAVEVWWHDNADLNATTEVAADRVRRSTVYDVRVAPLEAPGAFQDSFVYMSIPRSGRAKDGYTQLDGAEFAAAAGSTLSYSTFLYDSDAWLDVEIKSGAMLSSVDEVTIRPTTLGFEKELVDERTIRILVPYAESGYRFSVEFASELMTSYKADGALSTEPIGPAVHTEPRNGLVIFAEPMLDEEERRRLEPDERDVSIHYPGEGRVTGLDDVTEEAIYFRPGTYYMGGDRHAFLSRNVRWLYFAPGAYVKGAFQFRNDPADIRVTGYGVISGEQYVYEPDRDHGYRHRPPEEVDCHDSCVKILEFSSRAEEQRLTVHGITIANPPYHSFVVYGVERRFFVDASHGKHVGGWYWQTDGIEVYSGSTLSHMFFHLNDDALKLYAGEARVEDIVIWKLENGPAIQWGWSPRNIDGIEVQDVHVIHNRMYLSSHNSCIVNSARHYLDPSSPFLAEPAARIANLLLRNIRSEGMNLCAMRLFALAEWENIEIRGLWIESWSEVDAATAASRFEALRDADGERVRIGNETVEGRGLLIENFVVGEERITKEADNWRHDRLGRLDFDSILWESWNAR